MSKTKKISKAKQANKKKQTDNQIVSSNELVNLIKIVVIVCVVLLVFYFITVLVNKKEEDTYKENTTATIQYSKILVGQILNRSEQDYYVLVEKENDQYVDLYNYYLASYDGENKELKYYTVDLSDVFNGNNIGEETILTGSVSDFKFADTTLLRVQDKVITEVYNNRESIVSYLENLK